VAYPEDVIEKFKKAKDIRGTRYIQIMAPCPTGWKLDPKLSIWIARRAVTTRIYPMIEITENGEKLKVFKDFEPTPFDEYIKAQGRFRHLSDEEIAGMEEGVEESWNRLLAKEKMLASIPGMDVPE
jgi:pyruvate/2-oxoacid:ferredoxin oxidoreductase beta subunit